LGKPLIYRGDPADYSTPDLTSLASSHPNKLVLWPVHPCADDRDTDLFVQRHDVFFEVLQKIIHLALLIV
jgi:hypothetical protein